MYRRQKTNANDCRVEEINIILILFCALIVQYCKYLIFINFFNSNTR